MSLADRLLSELARIEAPEQRRKPRFEVPEIPSSPLSPQAPTGMGGGGGSVRPSEPVSAPVRGGGGSVVYVGDSLGVGTAPHVRGRENVLGGRSSASGVQALRELLGRRDADTVVFDLGTNDQGRSQLADSIRRAQRLAGRDTTFVIPTVRGPNAAQKNRLIRGLQAPNVRVVDWARAPDRLVSGDRIHATPGGYRRRARMIRRSL